MANSLVGLQTTLLVFDGSEEKYGQCWTCVLIYTVWSLKRQFFYEPVTKEQIAVDQRQNAYCYAELIRLVDDKSLSLKGAQPLLESGV